MFRLKSIVRVFLPLLISPFTWNDYQSPLTFLTTWFKDYLMRLCPTRLCAWLRTWDRFKKKKKKKADMILQSCESVSSALPNAKFPQDTYYMMFPTSLPLQNPCQRWHLSQGLLERIANNWESGRMCRRKQSSQVWWGEVGHVWAVRWREFHFPDTINFITFLAAEILKTYSSQII